MLGMRFQLTPAQVDVLLILNYRPGTKTKLSDGRVIEGLPLELVEYQHFLNSANALVRKGLLEHDSEKWVVTEEGQSVAKLIYKKAKKIVDWVEVDRDPISRERNMIYGRKDG